MKNIGGTIMLQSRKKIKLTSSAVIIFDNGEDDNEGHLRTWTGTLPFKTTTTSKEG